ncbi:hypothetical protein AAF712_015018 [Marasmius tenuissimus]|uniref:Uncharacterized protein n=1 Tax=Marasmius tenuissimus TaxID=585030 RepID=A0ABR2ZAR1_9AGAR
MAAIALAATAFFYLATTIAPSIDIIRQALQVEPKFREVRAGDRNNQSYSPIDFTMCLPPMEFVCPYKSPQAWFMFQGLSSISRLPIFLRTLHFLSRREYLPSTGRGNDTGSTWAFAWTMSKLISWPCVDLEILQRSNAHFVPHFHELNALRWLAEQLRKNPIMLPHLQNILDSTLPPHLVLPGVLDSWFFPPNREWTSEDVRMALQNRDQYSVGPLQDRGYYHVSLTSGRETIVFNNFLHHCHLLMSVGRLTPLDWSVLPRSLPQLWNQSSQGIFDAIGLIDKLSTREEPSSDTLQLDFVEKLPEFFNGAASGFWRTWASVMHCGPTYPAASLKDVIKLMDDLGRYISDASPDYSLHAPTMSSSFFIRSSSGLEFIRKLHTSILKMGLIDQTRVQEDIRWVEAIDIVRRVHQLPINDSENNSKNSFEPYSHYFPLSLAKLEDALRTLSPMDSNIDFAYLNSYSQHWDRAYTYERVRLIQIVIDHINNHPLFGPRSLEISPLVLSSPGIKLINFLNNRLSGPDQPAFRFLERRGQGEQWPTALTNVFCKSLEKFEAILSIFRAEGYKVDWDSAKTAQKLHQRNLVQLLCTYINTFYAASPTPLTASKVPPTSLLSSEALDLATFVNNRLAEDQSTSTWKILEKEDWDAWTKALERARHVHELSIGHFRPIPHQDVDSPGSTVPCSSREGDQAVLADSEEIHSNNGTARQVDSEVVNRSWTGWHRCLGCMEHGCRQLLGYLGCMLRIRAVDPSQNENHLEEIDAGDRNV